jgi:hypothetical protein
MQFIDYVTRVDLSRQYHDTDFDQVRLCMLRMKAYASAQGSNIILFREAGRTKTLKHRNQPPGKDPQ